MLHIRKTLTKVEQAEVDRWERQRRAEVEAYERANPVKPQQRDEAYWAKVAAETKQLAKLHKGTVHIPSAKDTKPEDALIMVPQLDPEMQGREELAQLKIKELKKRTGPAYNKGNYVFYSDGMLEDMKQGTHRRR